VPNNVGFTMFFMVSALKNNNNYHNLNKKKRKKGFFFAIHYLCSHFKGRKIVLQFFFRQETIGLLSTTFETEASDLFEMFEGS